MNYRLILQYDGSRYDGWQRQGNTEKTVQGKIEEVLSRLLEEPVEIDGQEERMPVFMRLDRRLISTQSESLTRKN